MNHLPLGPASYNSPARKQDWRLRAVLLAALGLAGAVGCGAPQRQADREAAVPLRLALPMARQAAARRDWPGVLAAQRRSSEASDPLLLGLAAQAAWQLPDELAAQQLENRLVQLALSDQPKLARREIEKLASLHLGKVRRPAQALRLLAAAMPRGCDGADLCRLAAKSLVMSADGTPAWQTRVLALAPAAERGAPRTRWMSALASELVLQTRAQEARELLLRHASEQPQEAERWAAAYAVARKQPGVEGRAAWMQALMSAAPSAQALAALSDHPELSGDRAAVAQILTVASQRADADRGVWQRLVAAWMRLDDRRSLAALQQVRPEALQDTEGRQVLVRALLAARMVAEAEKVLGELPQAPPEDAVTLALRAEWQRQAGHAAQAKTTAAAIDSAPGDRSLAALILGQTWRTVLPELAEKYAELAANTPGRGQLAAARLRAQRLFTAGPTPPAMAAVQRLGRLLAVANPGPGPGPLGEEREADPAALRQEWLAKLASGGWLEVQGQLLTRWCESGVATAEQQRRVAMRAVQQEDLAQFLLLDARARQQAEQELAPLDNGAVLQDLSRRSAVWLARWLAAADVRQLDDARMAWRTARQLLRGGFGALGLAWLDNARQNHPDVDIGVGELQELAQSGAAQAVLDHLTSRSAEAQAQDPNPIVVRVSALVALGQFQAAEQTLMDAAGRKELPSRAWRPLLEAGATHGLCRGVHALALKMAAEPDLFGLRTALGRGLDCARRQQDPALATALVRASQGERFDANRAETAGQLLVERGFEQLALGFFEQVAVVRPLSDDSVMALARAQIVSDQLPKALETLQKATTLRGRASRLWLRAAELLEDYSHSAESVEFFRGAVAVDPDATRLRVRLILALLRSGQMAEAAIQTAQLAQQGATEDDYRIVLEMGRRAQAQGALLTAVKEVADADRELERFRVQMAVDLGDRPQVVAGVRRLRAKGAQVNARLVEWLESVGALREAREAAEDGLASADPSDDEERVALLEAALRMRRDPTSADEALGLARLFAARALDADRGWALAAMALSRLGFVEQAEAAARAWKTDRTLSFACLRARFAWDAGKHAQARQIWAEVRAHVLVDSRTREVLRAARATPSATERRSEVHQALLLVIAEMNELGLGEELLPFLDELLVLAPDSELIHAKKIQTLIAVGRGDAAREAWTIARGVVRNWTADLAATAERLAQSVGAEPLMTDAASDGPMQRTDDWWLALVADMAAQDHEIPGEISAVLQTLVPAHAELRLQWALKLAQRGQGEKAAALLGEAGLACREDLQDQTARTAAAILVSVQGQAQAKGLGADQIAPKAQAWLQKWLGQKPAYDAAARLALELVRQGHPELAQVALRSSQGPHVGFLNADLQMRRTLAVIGAGDDEAVVAAVQQYLRGQRSNLLFTASSSGRGAVQYLPSQPVRSPVDDVFDWLITAGRLRAATRLAEALRREEPGQDVPPAAETSAGLSLAQRLAAWDADAAVRLAEQPGGPPSELLPQLVAVLMAREPLLALKAGDQLQGLSEEPWRIWGQIAEAAADFAEVAAGRQALIKARQWGAPQTAIACLAVDLGEEASASSCLRGRNLGALSLRESHALANALSRDSQGEFAMTMRGAFVRAPVPALRQWLSAAAAGQAQRTPKERTALANWLGVALQSLPAAAQEALVVVAMEDLGELGLGALGVRAMSQVLERHPTGHGYHNNLAYALHLAGDATPQAAEHARWALWATGGEPAFAALDTLAATMHREGNLQGALVWQKRALAAALAVPSDRNRPAMALPWARYSEFLLQSGDMDQARRLSAEALRRLSGEAAELSDTVALYRLRQVLKTALRSAAWPNKAP